MRKLDRNPYDGIMPELTARYPATSPLGMKVRRDDAKLRLMEMDATEDSVREQERLNSRIADRIARRQAEHGLNMQYLIEFGVTATQRQTFRDILNAVTEHGELTLFEAAELARARTTLASESSPGDR